MRTGFAQIFTGPGQPFHYRRFELPSRLQPGEVLVEIRLATICGSDLHTVDGRRSAPTPCILGHEGVGRVLESDRSGISIGQRVSWTLADSCGHCPACQSWNLPQKCDRLFKYGHASFDNGHGLNGCYASHVVLRSGTTIVPVPDDLSDCLVAPANCALATVVNALSALPERCERVLIQGAGLLGVYATAWLKSLGVDEIYCVDICPTRLNTISQFGGIPLKKGETISPFDLVMEVAGTSQVVADGIELLRSGGHYIWAGMVHPQTKLDITGESIIKKCLTVRGVHNYAPLHLQASIEFLAKNQHAFPFSDLTGPPLKLLDLDRAFELARNNRWLRVCVEP